MSKKIRQKRLKFLLEYMEPLSDIYALDIGVLQKSMTKNSYIIGRFTHATKKKLTIMPYSTSKCHNICVNLEDNEIYSLEIKTIRSQMRFISDSSTCVLNEFEPTERLSYEKSIFFRGDDVRIVGRFLEALIRSISNRKLKVSTATPGHRPDNICISSTISACTILGKAKGKVTRRKKEFFFKEKISEGTHGDK